jgi:rod shape-determining protein MreD
MMPRGADQLLLPANPWFIGFSLIVALGLNMVPLGRQPASPDLLAIALVFWTIHQPRRIGIGIAFILGVLMDVHDGAILGQHALSYTVMSFLAVMIHRRLLWFDLLSQAVQVLPLFVLAHALSLLVRLLAGDAFPGWSLAVAPLVEALLWPLASWLLLAPQRRPPDPDQNRPL